MRPEVLRRAVREKYRDAAILPTGHFPYPVGRSSAEGLGYEAGWLGVIPPEIVDRFVGVGNPFTIARPRPGQRVLDVGCGCGFDVFVASLLVGPAGRAFGVDLTAEMVAHAGAAAAAWAPPNLTFTTADVESLPFPDQAFDLVISNGALNLAPDKDRAFRELARVLRRGGRLATADLLVKETVPADVVGNLDAWST